MDDEPPLQAEKCGYCRHDLDTGRWASEWGEHAHQHYKSVTCDDCGKRNWLKLDFIGSGHDLILQGKQYLESIVQKVKGGRHL